MQAKQPQRNKLNMHQQNVEFRNPDLPLDSPLIIENDPKNERPEDERPPMKKDF